MRQTLGMCQAPPPGYLSRTTYAGIPRVVVRAIVDYCFSGATEQ